MNIRDVKLNTDLIIKDTVDYKILHEAWYCNFIRNLNQKYKRNPEIRRYQRPNDYYMPSNSQKSKNMTVAMKEFERRKVRDAKLRNMKEIDTRAFRYLLDLPKGSTRFDRKAQKISDIWNPQIFYKRIVDCGY
ncbi:hypothetical protein GJ496_001333 [Pomphorhynchus laevis]|nr:hypothetical protein GJ496_001333 [Pomphorhynchus laevis]